MGVIYEFPFVRLYVLDFELAVLVAKDTPFFLNTHSDSVLVDHSVADEPLISNVFFYFVHAAGV